MFMYVYACVCQEECIWRSKIDVKCLPQLLILIFETLNLEFISLVRLDSQYFPGFCLSLPAPLHNS